MNLTMQLLQILDSPFTPSVVPNASPSTWPELFRYATKNRISFFYLEAINQKGLAGKLEAIYRNKLVKYVATIDAISRISQKLVNGNIEHVIFKTMRPYRSTTVDIDVLIFGTPMEYRKAIRVTENAGYRKMGYGPMSTTFRDPEINIGIDLYREIAVGYIIYIDKKKLVNYMDKTKLSNGEQIKILTPEADLVTIIAHSVIKEQMYTLSEYYTFIHYLKKMNIPNFVQLVKQNNVTHPTRIHSFLAALLHKAAYKAIPNELKQLLNYLGEETFETNLLIQNSFKTPHKYHILTVARCLLEITKGKKSRNSVGTQIQHMLNPKFAKGFFMALADHITRETY